MSRWWTAHTFNISHDGGTSGMWLVLQTIFEDIVCVRYGRKVGTLAAQSENSLQMSSS